jgi:small subunit ribosomal protein S20
LAHSVSAKKRIRQNATKHSRRHSYESGMRTMLKKFSTAVEAVQADVVKERGASLTRHFDTLVAKGIIHKNQAARRKSRIAAKVRAVAAKGQTAKA